MRSLADTGFKHTDKVILLPGMLDEFNKVLNDIGYYDDWILRTATQDTVFTIREAPTTGDVFLAMPSDVIGEDGWYLPYSVTRLLTHAPKVTVAECDYCEGDRIKLIRGMWIDFIRDVRSVRWIPPTAIKHFYEHGVATIDGVDIDGDVYIVFDGGSGYMSPELLKYFEFVR